jgi:hypothetical protein
MLNEHGDGCYCDYCGDQLRNDFIYYSLDFHEVKVANRFKHTADDIMLSVDFCERCMELYRQRLKEIAKTCPETPSRCDVTGEDMGVGDNTFYQCKVSRVIVNLSSQPYTCVNCGKPREPREGPCDCDGLCSLQKKAKTDIDKDYVELNFSAMAYSKFLDHLTKLKEVGEAEWTK